MMIGIDGLFGAGAGGVGGGVLALAEDFLPIAIVCS
jgi:hypothetical protein